MTKPGEITGMAEDARRSARSMLVYKAGFQHVKAIETFPVAKWDAI